jgi:hypothetical protein
MWVSVMDVLPVKGEFKVKLEDGTKGVAFYSGFSYIDRKTRQNLSQVTHWFREKKKAQKGHVALTRRKLTLLLAFNFVGIFEPSRLCECKTSILTRSRSARQLCNVFSVITAISPMFAVAWPSSVLMAAPLAFVSLAQIGAVGLVAVANLPAVDSRGGFTRKVNQYECAVLGLRP